MACWSASASIAATPPKRHTVPSPHAERADAHKLRKSYRLTPEAVALLERAAKERGISQTAVLEMAVRDMGGAPGTGDVRAAYLGSPSEVAKTDLSRYRRLVRGAQARLAREGVFTPAEGAAILDALNGTLLGDRPETLHVSVEDAIALEGLAEKRNLEAGGAGLVEKLRSLTPLEMHAVADRVEMFWALVGEGKQWDIEEGLFREKAKGS
jgi:hypothetical protein